MPYNSPAVKRILTASAVMGMLIVTGCSHVSTPTTPTVELTSAPQNLEFVSFADQSNALNKVVLPAVVDYVTYKDGGEISLDYVTKSAAASDRGALEMKTTFTVPPESISEDALLRLTVDPTLLSGDVDVTFYPHGIMFAKPALLNIEVKGADVSDLEIDKLGLWYTSDESGVWQQMVVKEIVVDKEAGYLRIIDAQIPHFSRYALAHAE
ncbi:hypothetical protein JW960_07170 [candidate division KSB1 bacterium]|nr:hypothetical protein [candidate division KSB1 bacterium]